MSQEGVTGGIGLPDPGLFLFRSNSLCVSAIVPIASRTSEPMRAANFLYIVYGNLTERKGRTLGAILVVAFAAAVVTAVAAVSFGFLSGMVEKAEAALPPDILTVKPRSMDISFLSLTAAGLTPEVVSRIEKLPGVEWVSPQLALRMPLRASGSVMGQSAETDAVVVGVGHEIVQDALFPGYTFDDPPDLGEDNDHSTAPVPTVVPRFFLDMYNLAYADSVGLPKINESFLRGKEVTLHLGETYLLGSTGNAGGKTRRVTLRVVGMTANPSLMSGIMIPLSRAESLNEWYTGRKTHNYNAAHVKVADPSHFDAITSAIRSMDLIVESQRERLDQIRFVARAGSVTVGVFAAVILAIAAVSILNTFALIMNERRGEVGLLRAVGGTRRIVTALYAAEAVAVGLLGGLAGALISGLALYFLDRRILASLPHVTFLPERLFTVTPGLLLLCALGVALVCLAAALPVIRRTTQARTASVVGEN